MSEAIGDSNTVNLLLSELEDNLSDDSGIEGWEYDRFIDQEQLPFDDDISNETNEDVIRLKTQQRQVRQRINAIQQLFDSVKERSFYPRLQAVDRLENEIREVDSNQVAKHQAELRKNHDNLLLFYQKQKVMEKQYIKDVSAKNSHICETNYKESISELRMAKMQKLYTKRSLLMHRIHRFSYHRKPCLNTSESYERNIINGKSISKHSFESDSATDQYQHFNGYPS